MDEDIFEKNISHSFIISFFNFLPNVKLNILYDSAELNGNNTNILYNY